MSCIYGYLNLDQAPVDQAVLKSMGEAMEARAPDGNCVWVSGNIGLGNAKLSVAGDEQRDQPCTLDNEVWITADARIDAQDELVETLNSHKREVSRNSSDAELILHSYYVFGESFIEHIIGDFAFVLWDTRTRKLICARDHLGVRSFFYFKTDKCFAFASDLDALRKHPDFSAELNDIFIADFLLFGGCVEQDLTVYRKSRRLPPSCFLIADSGRFDIKRYWEAPSDPKPMPRASKASARQEEFLDLLLASVNDRVRGNNVALELSGGLDSGALAAMLTTIASNKSLSIQAYNNCSPTLLPHDQEPHFAELTANHLDIPVHFQKWEEELFAGCLEPQLRLSEPCLAPDIGRLYQQAEHMKLRNTQILITGQMGDALFGGSATYYPSLKESGQSLRVLVELIRSACIKKSIRGLGLRNLLLGYSLPQPQVESLPAWLHEEFVQKVDIASRWDKCWQAWNQAVDRRSQFSADWLAPMLEGYSALKLPIIPSHPLCDVRLLQFMLNVPNFELIKKRILRQAMRNRLPEPVRQRSKTPLVGNTFSMRLLDIGYRDGIASKLTHVDNRYINAKRLQQDLDCYSKNHGIKSAWSSSVFLAPIALDYWLKNNAY